jgi:putative flippase GtrA
VKSKEIIRFIVVGSVAVLIDFLIYNLCLNVFSTILSKIISFISGSTIAFVANKWWTFGLKNNKSKEIIKFGLLYLFTMLLNTVTNNLIFNSIDDKNLSFIFATGLSSILNFLGQKYWVFK